MTVGATLLRRCVALLRVAVFIGAFIGGAPVRADAGTTAQPVNGSMNDAAIDALRAAFARQYPATSIDHVRVTPLVGLFEIRAGRNVFYTDAQARYVLFGHLFDLHTQTDLTARAQPALARIAWDTLPLQHALVQRRGSGARRLAVFADPQCPHCRALAATLEQLTDITVYTFIVPILGPRSIALAHAVWCAADPVRAWAELMRNPPVAAPQANAACDTPTAAIQAFVEAQEIGAVPTLINVHGTPLRGAPSLEQLQRFVAEAS